MRIWCVASVFVIGIAVWNVPATVRSDAPKGEAAPKSESGLQLKLSADMTALGLDNGKVVQPAMLRLTFTNLSDRAIKLNAYDFFSTPIECQAKAMPTDSVTVRTFARDRVPPPPKAEDFPVLKPGETWSFAKDLSFPGTLPLGADTFSDYSIQKPGEFRVRFKYVSRELKTPLAKDAWVGELTSNEIVFTAK